MKKKSLIHINHKVHSNAFIFQALFSAIILAVAFLLDDIMDGLIDEEVHAGNKKYIKLSIHVVFLFLLFLIVLYLFKWIFGWGDNLLG